MVRLIGNIFGLADIAYRGRSSLAVLVNRRYATTMDARSLPGLKRPGYRRLPLCGTFVALAYYAALSSASLPAADLAQTAQLFRSGKYAECVQAAEKAIAENDFSENYRLLKIRAEMELGRYADALKTFDDALKRFPYSLQLRWLGREVCLFNHLPERAKKLDVEITQMIQQAPWRYSDAVNQVVVGRFYLSQGIDPKKVLDSVYNVVKKRQPSYVDTFLASGDLALDKNDYALAAEAYQAAIKLDPGEADAHYGLARAYSPSDSEKAEAALKAALKWNPNHVKSLLLVAEEHIDAERYDEAEEVLSQIAKINPHQPRALALRAVIAHLKNQPESERFQRLAALRHWPTNPEVDHLIGRKLSQKYRFAEGEKYQRQALEFDANYVPAKMQLAQDLLRLGKEEEGWKLADDALAADGYNVVAHNLVTLQENIEKFRTLEEDGLLVRMDAREAEIYGQRVLELLKRARRDLAEKYEVELPQPIIVELFPKQADFAIRTFGLPGGAGFLGVCFGTVITANSPASQTSTPTCWEATLWHEFCHVVTLNKTNNKMPRWLSEGISVYEERQASRTWGQTMTPKYREMLLGDGFVPLSKLSGAFLSPPSPLHLQFAYFESSLAVEYLIEKHGLPTLKRVLIDLGAGLPINESLARYGGSLDALDTDFAEYARKQAKALAPDADWSEPELPRRATSQMIAAWLKDHPHNYAALGRLARQLMNEGKLQEAIEPLEEMQRLYPDDESGSGPYAVLSEVYRELKDDAAERKVLERLAELSDDDVEMFSRLTELCLKAEDWTAARQYAERWLAVNPLLPGSHRVAAAAAEALKDDALAIGSYQALLLLQPLDPAEIHLKLATLLERKDDLAAARRHALLALEETPRFRAAHERLLAIVRKIDQNESPPPKPAADAAAGKENGNENQAGKSHGSTRKDTDKTGL
jgi:tetratricopeptide (TPR) repeat protein